MKRIRLRSAVFVAAVAITTALAFSASASANTAFSYVLSIGKKEQIYKPNAVAVDSAGNVWVADEEYARVAEFNPKGELIRQIEISEPADIRIDSAGHIWVSSTNKSKIIEFNSEGKEIGSIGELGFGKGQLWLPTSFAIDSSGNFWIVDEGNMRIEVLNSAGKYVSQFNLQEGSGPGQFHYPNGIAIDSSGNLWISDWIVGGGRVQKFSSTGAYLSQVGEGYLDRTTGDPMFDGEGHLWITDDYHYRFAEFDTAFPKNGPMQQFGTEGSGPGQFVLPAALTFDSVGNVWVADKERVEKWSPVPDTTITGGSNGKVTPDVSFTFSSNEGGSTFECALDAGAYAACSSPKTYEALAEGAHTFKVRAVKGGVVDPTPAERILEVKEVAKAVSSIAVLDDFGRSELPLANGKWTKTSWATEIGASWTSPWHGYGANGSTLAGAYWNGASFSDATAGLLVSATVGTGSTPAGQYMSLWLDMPSPGSARSGYEARFTGTNGTSSGYKVELSRWISGAQTVLGSKEGVSLPVGTTFVLTETGSKLNVWTGTSSFSRVISA